MYKVPDHQIEILFLLENDNNYYDTSRRCCNNNAYHLSELDVYGSIPPYNIIIIVLK